MSSQPPPPKRSRTLSKQGSRTLSKQGSQTGGRAKTSTASSAAAPSPAAADPAAIAAAADAGQRLQQLYRLPLPGEVYHVLALARKLSPMSPLGAFAAAGVRLVGPFEVLQHSTANDSQWQDKELWLWHRYGYDPPEALTVLEALPGSGKHKPTGAPHWCYVYEAPDAPPAFVASHNGLANTAFEPAGDTVVAALLALSRKAKDGSRLVTALEELAATYALSTETNKAYNAHKRRAVATTFSGLGVVCPYDRETQVGYRPISATAKELRSILQRHVEAVRSGGEPSYERLDNLIQFANIANDEMDFGHALELGLDLFNYDTIFRRDAANLLIPTYGLLNRQVFADICKKHSPHRNRAWSTVRHLHLTADLEKKEHTADDKPQDAETDDATAEDEGAAQTEEAGEASQSEAA